MALGKNGVSLIKQKCNTNEITGIILFGFAAIYK